MLPSNKSFNITNVKFDQEIYVSSKVERFTEIDQLNPIPTDTIIYKTVTGIGATHSEIVSERSSIIVLPHISIVVSKHKHYKKEGIDTLAVYGETTLLDIFNYLTSDSDFAKFLTTPKGLDKIIKVCTFFSDKINYKKAFFLLIDECHKTIQDAQYRPDLTECMDHFFGFEQKAMVSATPIPPSDPRFIENKFKNVKVSPDFTCEINRKRYIHDVELIHTNSLVNTLHSYFAQNKSEHYCIFFNSIAGIKEIIRHFQLTDNCKIYCSEESCMLLNAEKEHKSGSEIDSLLKYNFFTSSFFNGLDIILDYKPDIILLTDYRFRDHTLLDPYTDILQIIGRFRKKNIDDIPYNKITHINNSSSFTNPILEDTALLNIEKSKFAYAHMDTLRKSLYDKTIDKYFEEALKTVKPYSKLLNSKGQFSHFLKDNYLNDERVKNYYKNKSALRSAYVNTTLYYVSNKNEIYEKTERLTMKKDGFRNSVKINKLMADALKELEDFKLLEVYYEQQETIEKLSFNIFEAYNKLGYSAIASLGFKKSAIDKELLKIQIEDGRNSYPIINIIHAKFYLNQYYPCDPVKATLQELYDEYDIKYVAKSTDVKRYFEGIVKWKKGVRCWVFTSRKLFPITQEKHV